MTNEEAIKNIKEHCYFANLISQAKEALDMSIKALEQEPKTGHWITHNESIKLVTGDTATGGVICSECGYKTHNQAHVLIGCPYKYCPDCGAKMKKPTLNEMRKYYGLEPITKHERS